MQIAVTGASGLIGSALVPSLREAGHDVRTLVRREPSAPSEIGWDPAAGTIDAAALAGVEAVVHLAGETIEQRWTRRAKRAILDSRVEGTRLLAETLAALEPRPRVLLCASGVDYYGDRGNEDVTEASSPGTGFLAGVAVAAEAAAKPAGAAGIRVVHMRQGFVVTRRGGAVRRMLIPFRLGLGGRVGSGRQWWSWVSLTDAVAAYRHALASDLEGPVNVTAPGVVTSAEFTRALGRALNRPTIFPLPAFAVKLMFGEMGVELLLRGRRAVPAKLEASGFAFSTPGIDEGLEAALGA
jgi:uncharacterized protein (TIGR01777 family)